MIIRYFILYDIIDNLREVKNNGSKNQTKKNGCKEGSFL